MNTFIHQNGKLTDRDNYNRLRTYYILHTTVSVKRIKGKK